MGDRSHWDHIRDKRKEIFNVREEIERTKPAGARAVRAIGNLLANPLFFAAMVVAHAVWILANLSGLPWQPWDPYPFTFLATIASVEAPFIALLVLMHQQRASRIHELREETNLQISLHIERQLSLALRLLDETERRLDVPSQEDHELLVELQQELDPQALVEQLRAELRESEGGSDTTNP